MTSAQKHMSEQSECHLASAEVGLSKAFAQLISARECMIAAGYGPSVWGPTQDAIVAIEVVMCGLKAA